MLPNSGRATEQVIAWSHDVAGHGQKCVERYCELANKKNRAIPAEIKNNLEVKKKTELLTVF